MSILLTGPHGQLGQQFKRFFSSNNIQYTETQEDIGKESGIVPLIRNIRPTAIVNCAAYTDVDGAEKEHTKADRANRVGPKNLAICAEELDIPLVHFSSDYIFNGKTTQSYRQDDTPDPINYYGKTKLLGECEVRKICSKHIILRVSWLFGKAANRINFVDKVIGWCNKTNNTRVVSDQISAPSYTEDVVEIAYHLLSKGIYGVWHASNSGTCSRFDWAKKIIRELNISTFISPAKSSDFPTPAVRPTFSVLSIEDTERMLGKGIPSWEEATCRYLKEIGY